jgi:hypothetical protein
VLEGLSLYPSEFSDELDGCVFVMMHDALPLKATKSAKKTQSASCQPAPGVSGGNWRAGASLPLGVRGLIALYSCPWAKKYNPGEAMRPTPFWFL